MISDGKHKAKLFDLVAFTTSAGAPAVSFVWECDNGERILTFLAMTDSNGRTNYFGIQLTKRWAKDWNGRDLSWFSENREALLGTPALITTQDGKFQWIVAMERENESKGDSVNHCPPPPLFSPTTSTKTTRINLVVDPAKLSELPEHIEPTFEEAKALFDVLTEGTAKLDADKVWTILAGKVGPMQVDFGEAEWQQMIDRIRKLKSWSGAVPV